MKQRITLLLAVLLLLVGCKATALTPTDTLPDSKVSAPLETAETLSSESPSKAAESEDNFPTNVPSSSHSHSTPASETNQPPSDSQVVALNKEVSFKKWTSDQSTDVAWNDGIHFSAQETSQLGDVVLCRTKEELAGFLSEKDYPAKYADQYPASYFETKTLLLVEGCCRHGAISWFVDSISMEGETLAVSLRHRTGSQMATQAVIYNLYHVEINQKIESVSQIQCSVTFQKENSGTWITERTVTVNAPGRS